VGKSRVKTKQHLLQHVRVQGVRENKGQARFGLFAEGDRQFVEPCAGREDRLDVAQHLLALRGEYRLAGAAIEQRKAEVIFQMGDGSTDGGLAFTQAAGGGGERACGNRLDKCR